VGCHGRHTGKIKKGDVSPLRRDYHEGIFYRFDILDIGFAVRGARDIIISPLVHIGFFTVFCINVRSRNLRDMASG